MSRKKNIFFVSLHKPGKGTEDILPDPSRRWPPRYLTVGNRHDCDIIVSIPGIPPRHRFLEKRWSGYTLRIPTGMQGTITIGNNRLPIEGMIGFGLLEKSGNCYLFHIPASKICELKVEDITLTFGRKEIIFPKKKGVKLERALKKPWIAREDYTFFFILIISAIIHFSTVGYLNSIEIKREEPLDAINNIPQRFARLILEPPKEKVVKKVMIKPVSEEVEEEEKKEIEEKEKPQKEVEKEESVPPPLDEPPAVKEEEIKPPPKEEPPLVTEEPAMTPEPKESPPVTEEVAMIVKPEISVPTATQKEIRREKVRSRGLLGIITSKRGTRKSPVAPIFRDIEKGEILKEAKEIRTEKRVGDVLASLDIKSTSKIEKISIEVIPPSVTRSRGSDEIAKEKKEILLDEVDNSGPGEDSNARRIRGEAEVYKTVVAYVGGLKYLYNNALRKSPSLKGKITVRLTIAANGKVIKADIISSTLDSPDLEETIINRIYRWRFPELKDGEDYTIPYTFDFAPGG